MLIPYLDLLKRWHDHIVDSSTIPLHWEWGVFEYLSALDNALLLNKAQSPDELRPSRNFSVAAAVLGSTTAFERHLPITLEDCFTLIHQNLIVCTNSLNQQLLSPEVIDYSALPGTFKTGLQEMSRVYRARTSLDVNLERIFSRLQCALRNHSASLTLFQEAGNPSLQLDLRFFGEARERWRSIHVLAEALCNLGVLRFSQSSFKNDQELTLHCILDDTRHLKVTLQAFENMCGMTFGDSLIVGNWGGDIATFLNDANARETIREEFAKVQIARTKVSLLSSEPQVREEALKLLKEILDDFPKASHIHNAIANLINQCEHTILNEFNDTQGGIFCL